MAHEALFAAINSGDPKALEQMLTADPGAARASDANGVSAILAAVYRGNADAVAALRATGIELTLFEAAAVGDAARVQHLLETKAAHATDYNTDGFIAAGADPNAQQRHGWTPLHGAAQSGDRAVVEALLAAGADPALVNDDGKGAADIARQSGHADIATLLGAGSDSAR